MTAHRVPKSGLYRCRQIDIVDNRSYLVDLLPATEGAA